jgi:hypothetical protein
MTAESRIGRDLEGGICGLFEVIARNYSGGAEENHEILRLYCVQAEG